MGLDSEVDIELGIELDSEVDSGVEADVDNKVDTWQKLTFQHQLSTKQVDRIKATKE